MRLLGACQILQQMLIHLPNQMTILGVFVCMHVRVVGLRFCYFDLVHFLQQSMNEIEYLFTAVTEHMLLQPMSVLYFGLEKECILQIVVDLQSICFFMYVLFVLVQVGPENQAGQQFPGPRERDIRVVPILDHHQLQHQTYYLVLFMQQALHDWDQLPQLVLGFGVKWLQVVQMVVLLLIVDLVEDCMDSVVASEHVLQVVDGLFVVLEVLDGGGFVFGESDLRGGEGLFAFASGQERGNDFRFGLRTMIVVSVFVFEDVSVGVVDDKLDVSCYFLPQSSGHIIEKLYKVQELVIASSGAGVVVHQIQKCKGQVLQIVTRQILLECEHHSGQVGLPGNNPYILLAAAHIADHYHAKPYNLGRNHHTSNACFGYLHAKMYELADQFQCDILLAKLVAENPKNLGHFGAGLVVQGTPLYFLVGHVDVIPHRVGGYLDQSQQHGVIKAGNSLLVDDQPPHFHDSLESHLLQRHYPIDFTLENILNKLITVRPSVLAIFFSVDIVHVALVISPNPLKVLPVEPAPMLLPQFLPCLLDLVHSIVRPFQLITITSP